MKILILGANGMLGNACMNYFGKNSNFQVTGTVRSDEVIRLFSPEVQKLLISNIEISDVSSQKLLFESVRPDAVINCVGVVKQAQEANNALASITLNSLLPHQLSYRCAEYGAKLIHISTDCVFSGSKGSSYYESDRSDANDLYGRTKFLGEIDVDPNTLTIRTSYIGNELKGTNGLLEWFLSQNAECQGFTRAIYSGMPTLILAQALEKVLLEHHQLYGLFQVASSPISKYNLLKTIASVFKKKINIIPNNEIAINRSLDGSRFRGVTGFIAPSWDEMIEKMYLDRIKSVQK